MLALDIAQGFMRQEGIDAWLLYDYRGSNPVFWHVLDDAKVPTRRAFLVIPREGSSTLLIHAVDQTFFLDVPHAKRIYRGWAEMQTMLRELLGPAGTLAVEYSEGGAVPTAA